MKRCANCFLISAMALAACSPALNWREVRVGKSELKALLPCKPDHGSRNQRLGGQDVELKMLGCETEGALFAVASAELGDAQAALVAKAQWQESLTNKLQASDPVRETILFVPQAYSPGTAG